MASAGVNLAVTKDGGTYNKLRRPDDYLTSTTPLRPPLPAAPRPESHPAKRKRDGDFAPTSKRARGQHSFTQLAREAPVRECGTRSRLPGVDDDESLSDSSMSEALAYLRSVRSEALTIPPVLIAPTHETDPSEVQQELSSNAPNAHQTIYEDGVWLAIEEEDEVNHNDYGWDEDDYNLDPQESCYVLLLRQYHSLRHKLENYNVEKVKQAMEPTEEKPKVLWAMRTKQDWLDTIIRDYPVLEEVCQMNERTLFYGLHCCAFSLSQSSKISHQASCWAWTLLALIGDIGTLDNERMSRVRNLGLQAGRLGVRLRELDVYHQQFSDGSPREQDSSYERGKANGGDGEVVVGNTGTTKSSNVVEMSLMENIEGTEKTDTELVVEMEGTEKVGMSLGEHGKEAEKIDMSAIGDVGPMKTDDASLVEDSEELGAADHDQHDLVSGERNEQHSDGDLSESDAAMSISDNGLQGLDESETKDLEQARVRLLAQLGDRLVKPVARSRADAERLRGQVRSDEPQKAAHEQATAFPVKHVPFDIDSEEAAAESDWNTKAAIDMILTVVAECYGQRDLLKFREVW